MNALPTRPFASLAAFVMFVLVLPPSLTFADGCAPIAAKNDAERWMMLASSDHPGCWVRDPGTGLLEFLSNAAPNTYKPVIRQPSATHPTLPKPEVPNLPHGPTDPSLYSQVVGTWQGTVCGQNVATLDVTAVGSMLIADATSLLLAVDQRCDATQGDVCLDPSPAAASAPATASATPNACELLKPQLAAAPTIRETLDNGGFDGHMLWLSVTGKAQQSVQLRFSHGALATVADRGEPPTVFKRIQ